MIADLKPYSEYKESGSPWLGRMPAHWNLPRLGSVLRERGETNEQKQVTQVLSVLKDVGVIRYEDKGNIGNKKSDDIGRYKIVRLDDIVVNCMNVIIGSVGRSRYVGCLSPVYYVLTRRFEADDPRYLAAIFSAKPFQLSLVRIGNGILSHRMRIPMELLKCEPFPVPPPGEQAAIVRFLDWANGRLERAVRAKRKVIALLNEQKQAIIHRAVTRGLDPAVPLKPSGIPWLGDIPQHWGCAIKLKYISSLKGRLGWQGLKAHEYSDDGPAVVSSAHFSNQTIDWNRCPRVSQERYEMDANIQLSQGDILLMKDGAAMGKLAFVGDLPAPACLNSHLLLFRPAVTNGGARYDPKFMFYFMLTSLFQDYVRVNGTGATFLGVSQQALGNYKICLPAIDEQRAIAQLLDSETRVQNEALALVDEEIKLLREYRTRLVADVVTGKLDVREAAARLPDEAAPDTTEEPARESIDPEAADEEAAV